MVPSSIGTGPVSEGLLIKVNILDTYWAELNDTKDIGAHQYPKPYKLPQHMYLGFLSRVKLSTGL